MQYKTLGNTGLLVSQLCLGAMTFAGDEPGELTENGAIWKMIGNVGQSGVDALIKDSIHHGINFIDTADVYSEGKSEIAVGQSLRNLGIARKDIVIATKVFGRTGPGRNDVGASRGHIMDAVDASLKRLQTDHIDLYQIHGTDVITPIEETLNALDTLVRSGKVRYIGVSNWLSWKIAKALTSPSSATSPGSTPCRRTTPSPAAISSVTSSPCSKLKRPACSSGARSPAAFSRASSRAITRSPRTPAAATSTSPWSTRNAPGASSMSSSPSPQPITAPPPASRSPGYCISPS